MTRAVRYKKGTIDCVVLNRVNYITFCIQYCSTDREFRAIYKMYVRLVFVVNIMAHYSIPGVAFMTVNHFKRKINHSHKTFSIELLKVKDVKNKFE